MIVTLRPLALTLLLQSLDANKLVGRAEILKEHVEPVLGGVVVDLAGHISCAEDRVIRHRRDDARGSAGPVFRNDA